MIPDAARALLAPHRRLLLAVSGGPDSVALMLLAAGWRQMGEGPAGREFAVATVDHGLRPASRAEAEQVGDWAGALGFRHYLLIWEGDKPATRIQERAREARYGLLADCARRIGASGVVTAHHADDQAETILFRLTRGSGVSGLAGMAAQSPLDGLSLLRPLLGFSKADLVRICEEAGHPYFSDPSNANDAYARVRLRKLMPLLENEGFDSRALRRLGQRAARAEAALVHCAQAARAHALIDCGAEHARFHAAALRDLPAELVQRLLADEAARLAPGARLRLERLERAADRLLDALATGGRLRFSLATLLVEVDGEEIRLNPAPPRRRGLRES